MSFDWRYAAQLPIAVGGGQIPTRRSFLRLRYPVWVAAYGIHDNPRYWKHYWRIWTWMDVIADEDLKDFRRRFGPYPWLVIVPQLSFNDAIMRMKQLCAKKQNFLVSDERVKRADPSAPWDLSVLRANGARVAPAYDDDPDVPFFGHK